MSDSSLSSISDGSDVLRLLWGCPAPTTHGAQRYGRRRSPSAAPPPRPTHPPRRDTPGHTRGSHHRCRRCAAAATWRGSAGRISREERRGAERRAGERSGEQRRAGERCGAAGGAGPRLLARAQRARCLPARRSAASGAGTAAPAPFPAEPELFRGRAEPGKRSGRFPAQRRRWCRARRRRPGRARRGAARRAPRRAGSSVRPPAGRWVGAGLGLGRAAL